MTLRPNPSPPAASPVPAAESPSSIHRLRIFWIAALVLTGVFSWPLYQLVRFALGDELLSYIPLIPLVTGYLVWGKRSSLPPPAAAYLAGAITCLMLGVAALAGYWCWRLSGDVMPPEDALALLTFSYLGFGGAICCFFLGRPLVRSIAFPLCFLLFMVPLPTGLTNGIETALQHGSAAVAHGLFRAAGTPVFYHDLVFVLPGISLEVAPQCSGIHSSLVLLITSFLAGYMFLVTPWKRATLALAVIPLALLRNGFRVFTIGELCVHVGPEMIDSPIHHRGGPLFFALSLIPMFLMLFYLQRSDRSDRRLPAKPPGST